MANRDTKSRLLRVGTDLLLERGYHATGITDVLTAAEVPKGSFYHHFRSKEDFGLQIVQRYAEQTLEALAEQLDRADLPAGKRVHAFFSSVFEEFEQRQCRHGCLMGNLGQELADVNDAFRTLIEQQLERWAARIAGCLEVARRDGELPPETDCTGLARLLVDGFQGAALRMKLERSPAPLERFLAHHFDAEQRLISRHTA